MTGDRAHNQHGMHSNAGKSSVMEIPSLLNQAVEESVENTGNNASSPLDPMALAFRERKVTMNVPQAVVVAPPPRQALSLSRQPLGNAATSTQQKREGRPAYPREHAAFIWYQKDDLDCEWNEVAMRYRSQFGTLRKKSGLQCKYYRIREGCGAPPVRPSRKGGRDPHEDPVHCMFPVLSDDSGFRHPLLLRLANTSSMLLLCLPVTEDQALSSFEAWFANAEISLTPWDRPRWCSSLFRSSLPLDAPASFKLPASAIDYDRLGRERQEILNSGIEIIMVLGRLESGI